MHQNALIRIIWYRCFLFIVRITIVQKNILIGGATALLVLLIIIIAILIKTPEKSRVTFWQYGANKGWYPLLTSTQNALYIGNKQAYINQHSVLVDCGGYRIDVLAGAGILLNDNSIAVLRLEDKSIQTDLMISSVLSLWNKTAVTDGQLLVLDLKYFNDRKGINSQC